MTNILISDECLPVILQAIATILGESLAVTEVVVSCKKL